MEVPDRVMLVRYEDLVAEPEQTLRCVCTFLGEHYSTSMLDVPMFNSSVNRFNMNQGMSQEPVDRWMKMLSEHEVCIIERTCSLLMGHTGYRTVGNGGSLLRMSLEYLKLPLAAARALTTNRSRIANMPTYLIARLRGIWW